jgi:hypothetical protein
MRGAAVLGGCLSFVAWSQALAQAPSPPPRVCSAKGGPANAGGSPPWAITVSNEGLWCSHFRIPFTNTANFTFEVIKPPQHGELSQSPQGAKTTISYRPVKGYTGSDGFTLKIGGRNIEYPYLVSVIP